MKVPLETVQIGPWKYVSLDFEDIELLYELESSDLLINTNVRGSGDGVPALFRIKNISAADLSLVSVIPGSLESMVARLVLETDQQISYTTKTATMCGSENENKNEQFQAPSESVDLDVGMIKITASVHESGHLRDVLLFLKCNYQADVNPDSAYMRPRSSQGNTINIEQTEGEDHVRPHLTFVERLPYWAIYIPWMLYSKKVRLALQLIILLYTILSVLWALWQLYRHVSVIRVVMQPIIDTLKLYLSSVVEIVDWMFAVLTMWWHTYLSPLNVLLTFLLAPLFNLALQFKTILSPFYLALSQLLQNSALGSAIKSLFYLIGTLFYSAGSMILSLVRILMKPIHILNSRISVASLDFQRMRLSWVFNLIVGSSRSIVRGLAKVVGYRLREQKIKKAMMASSTPVVSPVTSLTRSVKKRRSDMPLLYTSPATKQD